MDPCIRTPDPGPPDVRAQHRRIRTVQVAHVSLEYCCSAWG